MVETESRVGADARRATDRLPFQLALAALVAASFSQIPEVAEARGFKLHPSEVTALLLMICIGAWGLRARRIARSEGLRFRETLSETMNHPGLARALVPLLAYGLVVVAGIVYAHDPARSVDVFKSLVLSAMLVVTVVVLITNQRGLRIAAWAIVATAMLLSVLNLYQYITGEFDHTFLGLAQPDRHLSGGYEIGGPFGNPNFLSQRLIVALPVAVWLFRVTTLWILKLGAATAAAACAAAVIASGSRGGLIALLVVTVMLIRSLVSRERRPALGVVLLLAFALTMGQARSREVVQSIPDEAASLFAAGPDANGRAREWTVAFAMYGDHPVVGVGAGNFPARYLEYAADTGTDLRPQERSPHSMILEIATETGILGLAAFGLLIVTAFDLLQQARRRLRGTPSAGVVAGFRIGLAGYLVSGLFISSVAYAELLWVLLAVAFACTQIGVRIEKSFEDARGEDRSRRI